MCLEIRGLRSLCRSTCRSTCRIPCRILCRSTCRSPCRSLRSPCRSPWRIPCRSLCRSPCRIPCRSLCSPCRIPFRSPRRILCRSQLVACRLPFGVELGDLDGMPRPLIGQQVPDLIATAPARKQAQFTIRQHTRTRRNPDTPRGLDVIPRPQFGHAGLTRLNGPSAPFAACVMQAAKILDCHAHPSTSLSAPDLTHIGMFDVCNTHHVLLPFSLIHSSDGM